MKNTESAQKLFARETTNHNLYLPGSVQLILIKKAAYNRRQHSRKKKD